MLFYFFLCTISMLIKSVIYGFYYILKVNLIFYRCPWLSSVGHWLMRFINSLIHGYTRLLICLHVWFASSKLFCLFSHLGGCNFLHILASCLWSRTCRPYNNSYVIPYNLWTLHMIVANQCGILFIGTFTPSYVRKRFIS